MAHYTTKLSDGRTVQFDHPNPSLSQQEVQGLIDQQMGGGTDWKGTVGNAIKSSFQKPAAFAKDLGTNPESMANVMPGLLGTAGAVAMPWGGATVGTGAGQGIRDAALTALGKPVPGMMQHGLELGGAALGDLTAVPAMKKSYFGGRIGAMEKAAGVPPAQDIPSIAMPTGTKSTSEFIDSAVQSVKGSEGRGSAAYWKQIKDQVDRLYKLGKDQPLTTLDQGKLRWLNSKVQEGLNAAVPGRALPAAALAQSQTLPRAIGNVYRAVPAPMKAGAAYGTGAAAMGASVYELIHKLMGGG